MTWGRNGPKGQEKLSYMDSPCSCWKDQKDKERVKEDPFFTDLLPHYACIAAGALERVSNADNFSQTRGGHGKYVVA